MASPVEGGLAPPPATPRQLTAVNTLLGCKLGVTGAARFAELEHFLDRPITSTRDLTPDEAGWVIDLLGARPDHAPPDGPGTEPFEEGT